MTSAPIRSLLALLTAVSLAASGCATNGLSSLPLPHPDVGEGGYRLTVTFSDALNLPAFAKVRLAGADIGQLEDITARDYTAVATLRIADGVRIPAGSTVELRSATPLGDLFIAVKPPEPPEPGAPMLSDGAAIPITDTTAAATVEDLLTGAAVLVNGGSVQSLTNLLNGAGRAAGEGGGRNLRELVDNTNRLLSTMNARTEQLSDSLTELTALSGRVNEKSAVIADLLDAAAPATGTLAQHSRQVADLIVSAGSTTEMLARFPSIGGTDRSGRSVIGDLNTISGALNDVAVDPDARLIELNRLLPPLIKASAGSAFSVRAGVDRLVLGSIPDIGFAGDAGLHGPKWYNFNQLIGSLKYTLFRLQERVVGRGPVVPQVPVTPSPTEPGQWEVSGPPPGPTSPGEFVTTPAPLAPPAGPDS